MSFLRRRAKRLERLNSELVSLMPSHVLSVSGDTHAALIPYLMVRMAWPDPGFITGLIFGFDLVGVLERPPFFRSTIPQDNVLGRGELLDSSIAYIDDLERSTG